MEAQRFNREIDSIMKTRTISLGFVFIIAISCIAESGWARGWRGGYRPGAGYGYRPGYGYGYRRGVACSPEVKQNALSVAQQTLTEVANSKEFENATRFRDFVAASSSLANADDKFQSYLSVVGVDSRDAKSVADFIGARDKSSYISVAEQKLGLTTAQADLLVERFSEAAMSSITQ